MSSETTRFQVLEELGSGSFGTVYKAIDKTNGDVVAIKHIDLESSEDDIGDIQAEIRHLSTCNSPYVTQYITSFLRGHKLWIVMEYLGGGSGSDLLKPGNLNEASVAIICREILFGLEYLHTQGKIHRDVKAANILLSSKGKVKLADFGVAAQLNSIKSQRDTFVGTPFWMAPEVIQESGHDYKADIWSLGITALEFIYGAPPHAELHPMKVLFAIPGQPAPRLEGSQWTKEFKDFIAQCLVKDPDRRPSAKEMLRHKFIRSAGKVEALQELIERKQMWDGAYTRPSHAKFYEETLHTMSSKDESDGWVFDTVKKSTIGPRKNTTKRRKLSVIHANGQGLASGADEAMKRLDLKDAPLDYSSPPPVTVKRGTVRKQPSIAQLASPTKTRQVSSQRRPLQADMSFGNTASTVRVFRRVSDNSTTAQVDSDISGPIVAYDENRPPAAEIVTKDAIYGRRVFNKVVDPAFQEVHAQTGNQAKRDALSKLADAWADLDAIDPEGEFQLMKLLIEKAQNDSKLSIQLSPSKGANRDITPQSSPSKSAAKLVLAQNNPHLKSHRRRQTSMMHDDPREKLTNLPGQPTTGMEHTKQLADVLYGRWAGALRTRFPAV